MSLFSTQTLVPNHRPEAGLLLHCVRPYLDAFAIEQIQSGLQQLLDWGFLLRMVDKHRVLPLFYKNLQSAAAGQVPPEFLAELRKRFFENAKRNLLLTNELLRLLQLFQSAEIRIIPYKGTVLAASVYGKQSLRQVWDLDVLVAEADVPRSRELLLEQGYLLKEAWDREQSFIHTTRQVEVDLHWGLTPFYFPIKLDFERLWSNLQPLTLAETTIYSFAPEDLLVILCIQVAKDCWERRQHLEHLAKVCDIATLLHTHPTLNWERVMQQATDIGVVRVVNFGLYLSQGLLKAELPIAIQQRVERDSKAIALAHQVCAQLFGAIDETFASNRNSYLNIKMRLNQLKFYLGIRERLKYKLQHIWEIFWSLIRASQLIT